MTLEDGTVLVQKPVKCGCDGCYFDQQNLTCPVDEIEVGKRTSDWNANYWPCVAGNYIWSKEV